jgi:hypothetical protein
MKLKINQQSPIVSPSEEAIAQAFRQLPPGKRATIQLDRGRGQWLYAIGRPDKGFYLGWQSKSSPVLFSKQADLDVATAVFVLTQYAQSEKEWHTLVEWQPPNLPPPTQNQFLRFWINIPPGLGAFFIFGGFFVAYMAYLQVADLPGEPPSLQDAALGLAAIVAISAYIQYIQYFFAKIRPFLASWLGDLLGMQIAESPRSGWTVVQDTSTGRRVQGRWSERLLVQVVDIIFLLVGLVGLPAIISIVLFVLAE